MSITKHGRKRVGERLGLPKKAVDRQFALAIERGYPHNKTKGNLHKWITKTALSTPKATTCIVYNNYLFVCSKWNGELKLITVLPIPSNIQKSIKSYLID